MGCLCVDVFVGPPTPQKGFPGQIGLGIAESKDEHIRSYEKELFHFV